MKKILSISLLAASFIGLVASAQAAASIGQPAPGFTLTASNGKAVSLSDYAGRIVVLEWVNHGCPFVKKHYDSKNMPQLQEKLTADGVVWLSICSSAPRQQGHATPEGWQKLISKHGMKSTAVLLDEDGKVGRLYGAKTTPHMYVIDASGVLAYNGAIDSIPSGSIADIEKAENYVASAVASLKAGEAVKTSVSRPYGCDVKYSRDS